MKLPKEVKAFYRRMFLMYGFEEFPYTNQFTDEYDEKFFGSIYSYFGMTGLDYLEYANGGWKFTEKFVKDFMEDADV